MEVGGGGWNWVEVGARFSYIIFIHIYLLMRYFNSMFLIVSKFVNSFMVKYTYKPIN